MLIADYLVWHTLSQRGPTIAITITFSDAEGPTAGQSQMRYRDVTVGTLESAALAPDRARMVVTVRMS